MQSAAERALERQIRAIEAGTVRRVPAHELRAVHGAGERRRPDRHAPTRRICRARSSRWIRAPAPCARSSAAAISTTASSIARCRRFASRDRRSSRSSTPTRSRTAARCRTCSTTRRSRVGSRQRPAVDAAELRGRLRRADPDAPRALPVAQRPDDPTRHRARHAERDRRGAEVRHHDADSRRIRRSSSARPTSIRSRWSPRTRRSPTLGTRAHADRDHAVEDQKGNVLWEPEPTIAPVMSPEEAWLMVSVMKDVVRRGTAAGSVGSQFSLSGRRQDGHDERRHRRLVHRLHVGSRRRRVDGLRQAAEDQGERAGRHSRRAGVDGVHERGLQAQAGAARLADARRHRHAADRRHDEHARRRRTVRATSSATSSSFRAPIRCCSATSTRARRCIPDTSGSRRMLLIRAIPSAALPRQCDLRASAAAIT